MRKNFNEGQTRRLIIDQEFARAGWGAEHRTLIEEFALGRGKTTRIMPPVANMPITSCWAGMASRWPLSEFLLFRCLI